MEGCDLALELLGRSVIDRVIGLHNHGGQDAARLVRDRELDVAGSPQLDLCPGRIDASASMSVNVF
jgi:hypothetical protein